MYVDYATVPGACGVGVVHSFEEYHPSWRLAHNPDQNPGGAGWLCAGFVYGNKLSDSVFEELKTKYKLVFQTPVRLNVNSDNMFYFAVFDTEGSGVPTGFDACDDL